MRLRLSLPLLPMTLALSAPSLHASTLKVSSFPSGAQVVVDGVNTGKLTPMSTSVTEGDHTVTVQIPGSGWSPDTRTVTVVAGNNDLSVTLLPTLTVGPQGPKGETGQTGPQGPQGPPGVITSVSALEGLACVTTDFSGEPIAGVTALYSAVGSLSFFCLPPGGFRDGHEPNDSADTAKDLGVLVSQNSANIMMVVEGYAVPFTFHAGDFSDWYRLRIRQTIEGCLLGEPVTIRVSMMQLVVGPRTEVVLHHADQAASALDLAGTCGALDEFPILIEVRNPTGNKLAPPNIFYDLLLSLRRLN